MITPENEITRSLTIIPLGYRARCAEAGCKNLGRMILRYADAGGRPMNNAEFCHAHARVRDRGGPRRGAQGLRRSRRPGFITFRP
jgi:hypothetical protein